MDKNTFVETLGAYVKKYAPFYGIAVCSPVIAQGILESAWGTSNKVYCDGEWRHNYFGLKWRDKRCAISNDYFEEWTYEQRSSGEYDRIKTKFCKFRNMEECVIGYFQWTKNYELSGIANPKSYLHQLKIKGYATSINYVDNLMKVIETYNLTRFDVKEEKSMIIALDAGHGLDTAGKRCLKTLDKNETREWFLNDRIADRVEELLGEYEVKVVRVGDTTGKKDISLNQRVTTANNVGASVYVSIHHNAGANGGTAGGTVVYYNSSTDARKAQAQSLYNSIVARTGLIGNRSSKIINYPFYVIHNTRMPAFLIENGFMDSKIDVPIILSVNHAEKTALGIIDFLVKEFNIKKKVIEQTPTSNNTNVIYKVQVGAFGNLANAENLRSKLAKDGYNAVIVKA